jgi:hypothetical protein
MAFECKERDIKTCKQLKELGLCEVYKNKQGKQACRKVHGARDVTLEDIARIRGLPKPNSKANAIVVTEPEPDVILSNRSKPPSGPVKTPELRVKTPSPLKPQSPDIEADSILATGIHHTLVEPIMNMDKDPLEALEAILNNRYLKENYNDFLDTVAPKIVMDMTEFYQTIHSRNFLKLLEALVKGRPDFAGIVRTRLLDTLTNPSIKTKTAPLIYRAIYNVAMEELEPNSKNTSIVVKTAKNVQTSEDIQSLGIDSYRSILRNFTKFRFFQKRSASSSIVLTGMLTPPEYGLNSVKVRNTLRPDQQFYFKIFPLGDVAIKGKLIQYDTLGLLAEYKVYSELFKLVQYNITPNILCKVAAEELPYFSDEFLGSGSVSGELRALATEDMTRINRKLHVTPEFKWDRTGLIVTMPGGRTFSHYFTRVTPAERKQIMFQLLYTFYVFEKLQISHGDIHTDNIFVVEVEPTELCYLVEGVQFRFITTKLVKIYDFDHSMIGKATNIRLDMNTSFTVGRVVNGEREKGGFFDKNYGECSVFNKNLDLVISILNGFAYEVPVLTRLNITHGTDVEVEAFVRDVLPGMNKDSPMCNETIQETYRKLFTDVSNIREAQEVFDMPFTDMANWVEPKTLGMTWGRYFDEVKEKLGRIVKSFTARPETNHLWIPDNVILPKIDMLRHPYFRTFVSDSPINVRTQSVYTLDNRFL